MSFINVPEEQQEQQPKARDKPTYLRNGTRSRRIQSLITPETHEALKRTAGKQGRSVNDLINEILDSYVKEQSR